MDIVLGDILEPIAPFCSPKDLKPWSRMVKVHLKNPSKDGEAFLTGKRVFAMEFDDCLRVPKIPKSFDNTAPKELLAIRVKGDNLKMVPAHQFMAKVVLTSFHCRQEFKITEVNKNKDGNVKKDQHIGVYNLEVLNPTIYKQYVKTTPKILNKYVTFRPHPRNLDGTNAPHEDVLKEFGFLDVNNVIARAMTTIANQATSPQPSSVSFVTISKMIKANVEQTKMEIRKDLEVMSTEVIADTHTYANIIVDDLKLTFNAKFKAILDSMESTRNLLLEGTPSHRALPPPKN